MPGRDREGRQPGREHPEVERARPAQLGGALEHPRVAAQQGRHLRAGPQVGGARGGQPAVHLGQAAAGPDGGQRLGQAGLRGRREVDVAGRHHAEVGQRGQPGQHVVALVVAGVVPAGQLHHHVLVPEPLRQRAQLPPGFFRAAGRQRGGHGALAAAGQHRPVAAVRVRQLVDVIDRAALLAARQLGGADHGAQPPVALGIFRQDQQVASRGVGVLVSGRPQAQLGAEHRAQLGPLIAEPRGGLRELRDPVHAVVVGQGERLEPEPGRLGDQLAGGGGPVEEAERGMAVQLGPRRVRPGRDREALADRERRRSFGAWFSVFPGVPQVSRRCSSRQETGGFSQPITSTPPRPASGRPPPPPARPGRRRW